MRQRLKALNLSRFDEDRREFDNPGNLREHHKVQHRLIYENFKTQVNLTTDVGSRRITPTEAEFSGK